MVINILKYISIYLAGAIVILHSLLPHVHESDHDHYSHELEHTAPESFLDFLEEMFHMDMGEGHLENFEQGSQLDFDLVNILNEVSPDLNVEINSFRLNVEGQNIQTTEYRDKVPILQRPFSTEHILRGPPSIS
ncbi:MAG: hypothetical protein HKN51_16750 [Saprospiraceae bacterium]|nr:hypothetical protein [Bacteroidia bacterium]NNE16634.1 hypothetical protein [Saprospiraceae bacterium]